METNFKVDMPSFALGYSAGRKKGGGGESGKPVVEKDVKFYDYDGTLLHSYTVEEAQALTELPEPPTHDGLTFQEWNYTLAEIKSHNRAVDVGATYITYDGKSRFYIKIEHEEAKTVTFRFTTFTGNKITINWGDGTDEKTFSSSASATHTYDSVGEYVIEVDAERYLDLGYNSNACFGSPTFLLQKVELGKIREIGVKAFYQCRCLKSITIPKEANINGFYDNPFEICKSLNYVVVPRGITKLPLYCFSESNIGGVSLPATIKQTDSYAFYKCDIPKIVLPDGVTTIGQYSFQNSGLKSLTLPASVTTVGAYSLISMIELEEFILLGSPTSFASPLNGCTKLKKAMLPSNLTSVPGSMFMNCELLENVAIPQSVKTINNQAFYGCKMLESVNIPDGVSAIPNSAFHTCSSLVRVDVPPSVTSIGTNAFKACSTLKVVDFSRHTSVPTLSGTNAFDSVASNLEIRVPAALYDQWIAATNWSTSNIKGKIVAV